MYQKLEYPDSIRLLYFTNPEHLSLTTTRISTARDYVALSYCWGTTVHNKTVTIDSDDVSISENLFGALSQLRNMVDQLCEYVWIDQICINQADKDERSQQVQMMRHIYSSAVRTVIWLGSSEPASHDKVLQLLHQTYQASQDQTYSVPQVEKHGRMLGLITVAENSRLGLPDLDSPSWGDLARFLSKPWFSRVWVIQEAAVSRLSPLVLCGDLSIEWETLSTAVDWLDRQSYDTATDFHFFGMGPFFIHSVRQFRDQTTQLPRWWSLEAILCMIRSLEATDPRDQIFALLGLTQDVSGQGYVKLIPDYGADMYQIFQKTVRYCIQASGKLRILGAGGMSGKSIEANAVQGSCPSWLPRWDLPYRHDMGKTVPHGFGPLVKDGAVGIEDVFGYDASRNRKAQVGTTDEDNALALRGLHTDTICWSSDLLHRDDFVAFETTPIPTLWETVLARLGIKVDRDDPRFAKVARDFYLTIVAGIDPERNPARDEPMCHFFAYLYYAYQAQSMTASSGPGEDEMEVYHQLSLGGDDDRVVVYLPGRQLFLTQDGRVGYGAAGLGVGDRIFILYGGDVPYVLRCVDNGFAMIGEAYVAGLMQGEMIANETDSDAEVQWVTLR